MTTPMGDGTLRFKIPNDPAYLHANVYVQAFANAGSTIGISNGLRLTIGGLFP
jgi:hypothetical protein